MKNYSFRCAKIAKFVNINNSYIQLAGVDNL